MMDPPTGFRDHFSCLNAGGVATASSLGGTECSGSEQALKEIDSAAIVTAATKDPRRSRASNQALFVREKPSIGYSRGAAFGNTSPKLSRRSELVARERPSIGHSRGAAFGNTGSPSRRSEAVARQKPSIGYSRGAAFGNSGPAPSRRSQLVARGKPSIGYSRGAAFGNPGL